MPRLKRVVVHRLMSYYRVLSDWTSKGSVRTVTSAKIGDALDIDPTQVRKDLAAVGVVGMGRVGFDVCEVCRSVRHALGFDRRFEAVLIGAGHLGGAVLAYSGFDRYGLDIVAAFDSDGRKVGAKVGGHVVKPMKALKPYVMRRRIPVAVLATPVDASQGVTDRLVAAGVKAIWNFAPTSLVVPPGVLVRNEHISRGLSEIAYHLNR